MQLMRQATIFIISIIFLIAITHVSLVDSASVNANSNSNSNNGNGNGNGKGNGNGNGNGNANANAGLIFNPGHGGVPPGQSIPRGPPNFTPTGRRQFIRPRNYDFYQAQDEFLMTASLSYVAKPLTKGQLNVQPSTVDDASGNSPTGGPLRRLLQKVAASASLSCDFLSTVESYTLKDWLRWDSYDLSFTYANPTSNTGSPTAADTAFRSLLYRQSAQNPMQTMNSYYQSTLTANPPHSFINDLTQANWFSISDVQMNVSMAINTAYNSYRCSQVQTLARVIRLIQPRLTEQQVEAKALSQFDGQNIDFTKLPGVNGAAAWLQQYLTAAFAIQSMTHTPPPGTGETWDTYGFFASDQAYGVGFNQRLHFFRVSAMSRLCAHYLHLLPSSYLVSLRPRFRAMLTALVSQESVGSPGTHSSSQWLLNVEAWAATAYGLKHSERILRNRRAWVPSYESSATNIPNGDWTTADAISYSEQRLIAFVTRSASYGQTEFFSEYLNIQMLSLGSMLQHAASQTIYDQSQSMYSRIWTELALQFTPFSGSLSGPTARTYDFFDGAHASMDGFDLPLFLAPNFQPFCADSWTRQLASNPSVSASFSVSCLSPAPPTMLPMSGNRVVEMQRLMYLTFQSAGYSNLPRSLISSLNLQLPRRVAELRFSAVRGQERCNFVDTALGIELGHAGEDTSNSQINNIFVARIGGAPRSGSQTLQSFAGPTNNLIYMRLMGENNDRPFSAVGHQAGELMQITSRSVAVQYQNILLVTSILAGQSSWMQSSDVYPTPWNTNLVAPLAANEIWADDSAMPFAQGSSLAIPPAAILTVRHNGVCFGARLVFANRSAASNIQDATTVTPTPLQSLGQGQQPYSLTWQINSESYNAGAGRFIVHHKHATSDTSYQPYRIVWLWAMEACADTPSRQAFQSRLRSAVVTQTFSTDGTWDESNQPYDTPPAPFPWYWGDPVGSNNWTVTATYGGHTLRVQRHDTYQPMKFASIYSVPAESPLNAAPYWIDSNTLSRTVDGVEQLQFSNTDDAYRWRVAN